MTLSPPTKPCYYLDASAYKESNCLRSLFYTIVLGLRSIEPAPALSYGSAIHKYVSVLREGKGHEQGIAEAVKYYLPYSTQWNDKEWRTLEHLIKSCAVYKSFYDNDSELKSVKLKVPLYDNEFNIISYTEKVLIEQKFCILIFENDFFKLYLCGTVDEVALYDGHEIVIVDRKTSSYYFKIDETLKMYQQSSQMLFYKYIIEKVLGLSNIRVLIEGVFLNSQQKTKIVRTNEPFLYEPWRVEHFKNQLEATIDKVIIDLTDLHFKYMGQDILTLPIFAMNYLCCDSVKYDSDRIGACKYFNLCANSDDGIREFIMKKQFKKIPYEPLKFGESE